MRPAFKQDDFGETRPSPIPVIVNPDTGDTEPAQIPQTFSGTPVALNTRDTVRELSSIINRDEAAFAAGMVGLWRNQVKLITPESITTGGLSHTTEQAIAESYASHAKLDVTARWEVTAAAGGSNVEAGIIDHFGMAEGILPEVNLPGAAANDWIRVRELNFSADFSGAQARAARPIIQQGLKEGLNERVVAQRLEKVIGLDGHGARAVDRLRAKLVKDGLEEAAIDKIVNRRAAKLLKARAKRIARTEMTWSYNMGQLDAVKAYQSAGWIPPNVIVAKKWRKVLPVPECFCDALNGQIIGIDATFPGATQQVQSTLTPPAHPNCACAIDIVIFEPNVFSPFIGGG